jgi:hypothetical protein
VTVQFTVAEGVDWSRAYPMPANSSCWKRRLEPGAMICWLAPDIRWTQASPRIRCACSWIRSILRINRHAWAASSFVSHTQAQLIHLDRRRLLRVAQRTTARAAATPDALGPRHTTVNGFRPCAHRAHAISTVMTMKARRISTRVQVPKVKLTVVAAPATRASCLSGITIEANTVN